jgi:hypothetical protein
MTALLIDDEQIERIKALVAKAAKDPMPLDTVMRAAEGKREDPAVQAMLDRISTEFSLDIPMDYFVCFTHEKQPAGTTRHLSVSIRAKGRVAAPQAISLLMPFFGFKRPLEGCYVWVEDCGRGKKAVNVVELITDSETAH